MSARFISLCLIILSVAACSGKQQEKDQSEKKYSNNEPALQTKSTQIGAWGVDASSFSSTIKPGDDFFHYVNEGWIAKASIPRGYPANNAFTEVSLKTDRQLMAIIDSLPDSARPGSPEQQMKDLQLSYLNDKKRSQLGISPLRNELAAIMNATDHAKLSRLMGKTGYPAAINGGVEIDFGDPTRYVATVGQGGISLPGRDYYLTEKFAALREKYLSYVERIFTMAEIGDAEKRAAAVLKFETNIAEAHWTPAMNRDLKANYHLMPVAELNNYAPGIDWPAYLSESGLDKSPDVIVFNDTAVKTIAKLFADTDVETLQSFMAFHLLNQYAAHLTPEWEEASFNFYSKDVYGIAERKPRYERAMALVNQQLGEAMARIYVDRYFSPEYKAKISNMIDYLLSTYADRLTTNTWMDDATRKEALTKLRAITVKVAYPDQWKDYSKVTISADDLVGNIQHLEEWRANDDLAKIGEPIRTWEWGMTPQTINAYYAPLRNEIVFPAAILQPPFFDPNADMAVNFGGAGMVIGHEIGHAFDDKGSTTDATGKLRNWWTKASRKKFETLTAKIVSKYSTYTPMEDMHVNGELTLGENIGDLGGVGVSLAAYKKFILEEQNGNAPVLDGYTGMQRFFLSFSQVWRNKESDDYLKFRLTVDPHSPNIYRVNGVVQNYQEWYDAFAVSSEDALFIAPEERVQIW